MLLMLLQFKDRRFIGDTFFCLFKFGLGCFGLDETSGCSISDLCGEDKIEYLLLFWSMLLLKKLLVNEGNPQLQHIHVKLEFIASNTPGGIFKQSMWNHWSHWSQHMLFWFSFTARWHIPQGYFGVLPLRGGNIVLMMETAVGAAGRYLCPLTTTGSHVQVEKNKAC